MFSTILQITSKIYNKTANKKRMSQHIYNNINIIVYVAAISTIAGGILHLLMLGPSLKPANFPMQLLPYTDFLFTVSGILQIFWCLPMIKRWGINWYYIGLVGTIGLSMLLLMTRIPNGITNLPLEDKNPLGLLTEVTQFLFIGVTIIIIKFEYANNILYRVKEPLKPHNEQPEAGSNNNDEDHWLKERCYLIKEVIENKNGKSSDKNMM